MKTRNRGFYSAPSQPWPLHHCDRTSALQHHSLGLCPRLSPRTLHNGCPTSLQSRGWRTLAKWVSQTSRRRRVSSGYVWPQTPWHPIWRLSSPWHDESLDRETLNFCQSWCESEQQLHDEAWNRQHDRFRVQFTETKFSEIVAMPIWMSPSLGVSTLQQRRSRLQNVWWRPWLIWQSPCQF